MAVKGYLLRPKVTISATYPYNGLMSYLHHSIPPNTALMLSSIFFFFLPFITTIGHCLLTLYDV